MKEYVVYRLFCKTTKKCYIGFTQNFESRLKMHQRLAKNGSYYPLYKAIRKYGWSNFEIQILEKSNNREYALKKLEPKFILEYDSFGKNGYNLTSGGEGVKRGPLTKEQKEKISIATKKAMQRPEVYQTMVNGVKEFYKTHKSPLIGRKHTPESIKKMSNSHLNMSEETKIKIGNASREMWKNPISRKKIIFAVSNPSEETRVKMSLAKLGKPSWNKGKHWTKQQIQNMGRIKTYQITFPNGKQKQITNLSEFCRKYNLSQGTLNAVVHGKRPQHKGFLATHA